MIFGLSIWQLLALLPTVFKVIEAARPIAEAIAKANGISLPEAFAQVLPQMRPGMTKEDEQRWMDQRTGSTDGN